MIRALESPGRGRYDRSLSPTERGALQRERLLRVAARLAAVAGPRALTVSSIVSAARMARNTFYAHFEDIDDLVLELERAAGDAVLGAVEAVAREPATPRERLRAIASCWLERVAAEEDFARALFGPQGRGDVESHAFVRLRAIVLAAVRAAHRDAVVSHPPEEPRLSAATAAVVAIGLRGAVQPSGRSEPADTIVDVVLRIFR